MSKVEGEVVYWRPTGSICIYKTQIFIYLSIVTELKLNVKINQDTTRKKNLLQFLLTKKVVEKRSLKFMSTNKTTTLGKSTIFPFILLHSHSKQTECNENTRY